METIDRQILKAQLILLKFKKVEFNNKHSEKYSFRTWDYAIDVIISKKRMCVDITYTLEKLSAGTIDSKALYETFTSRGHRSVKTDFKKGINYIIKRINEE